MATRCLDDYSIEKMSLSEKDFTATDNKKTNHISQCNRCSEQLKDFKELYHCIAEELEKAVSNNTLDMAKTFSDDVHYGLIACHPVSPMKEVTAKPTKFHSSLKFSGNGKYNQCRFSDFDFSLLQQGTVVIRVMTNTKSNTLLLYLWSNHITKFNGWRMKIPELNIEAQFSTCGECEVPLQKIKDLDDKEVFIYHSVATEKAETSLEKIVHALSD